MRDGRQISAISTQMLIHEVHEAEIKEVLFGIKDNKVPRVDGFNACFFKKAWNIIKQDVISAVKDFFERRTLFPPFNCTLVTLIPKKNPANRVGDYRSITCCTVIYKVNSRCREAPKGDCIGD